MFGRNRIYLDYASATPITREALRAMSDAETNFANPGSIHQDGVAARRVLEGAREQIASHLACKAREVVFTSDLTESNNLAIVGAARKLELSGRPLSKTHWITTSIEHSSVLACFAEVERLGGTVSHIEPDERGVISAEKVARTLKPDTIFASIGWANNEIGTVQPLREIARVIRAYEKKHKTKILFHSDAGQAPLYLSPYVHTLGVDLFSLGSGKLYGPRTAGALFAHDSSALAPVIIGGGQEKGLRSGTQNVVPAAGFAAALAVVARERAGESKRLKALRDELLKALLAHNPEILINGDMRRGLPHMLNISVPGDMSGEYLALRFDHFGVSLSTKSACDEGNQTSHVVEALGAPAWRSRNTLRFSLGTETSARDIKQVIAIAAKVIPRAA